MSSVNDAAIRHYLWSGDADALPATITIDDDRIGDVSINGITLLELSDLPRERLPLRRPRRRLGALASASGATAGLVAEQATAQAAVVSDAGGPTGGPNDAEYTLPDVPPRHADTAH